jgi:hypothetical protein
MYHAIHITALIVFVSEMTAMLFIFSRFTGFFLIVTGVFIVFTVLNNLGRYLQIERLLKGDQKTRDVILKQSTESVSEYRSFQYLRRILLITIMYALLLIINLGIDWQIHLIFPAMIAGVTVDMAWLILLAHYLTYIHMVFIELLALRMNEEVGES